MLVSNLSYSDYLGRLAIGTVQQLFAGQDNGGADRRVDFWAVEPAPGDDNLFGGRDGEQERDHRRDSLRVISPR